MSFTDYFIGQKNTEIESLARKLCFEKVIFIKEIKEASDFNSIENYEYVLINVNETGKMRQFIDKAIARKKIIIIQGKDDSFNRAALETKRIFMLLSPEATAGRDFMSYRNSGMNQVLCKIAEKNNVTIGISFSELLEINNSINLAERIGRIMQNIAICRKYKTKMHLSNFSKKEEQMRSALDLRSFGTVLGM